MSKLTYELAAGLLWQLMDDIDTMDDACRNDDAAFRRIVREKIAKRHQVMKSDGYRVVLCRDAPDLKFVEPVPEDLKPVSADKEGPYPPPCFTVTVVPAEETLEAFLLRNDLTIDVCKKGFNGSWSLAIKEIGFFADSSESLHHAMKQLCFALSNGEFSRRGSRSAAEILTNQVRTCSVIPGDIVEKIMAAITNNDAVE